MIHDIQSTQISHKQDGRNIYAIMKTMRPLAYHHNGFVATQVLGHIVYMIAYILRPCCFCAIWALCVSWITNALMTTYIYMCVYIYYLYIYMCVYIHKYTIYTYINILHTYKYITYILYILYIHIYHIYIYIYLYVYINIDIDRYIDV